MIDEDLNWKSHNTVFMHYSKNDVRYSHQITENSKYTNIAQPIFYFYPYRFYKRYYCLELSMQNLFRTTAKK